MRVHTSHHSGRVHLQVRLRLFKNLQRKHRVQTSPVTMVRVRTFSFTGVQSFKGKGYEAYIGSKSIACRSTPSPPQKKEGIFSEEVCNHIIFWNFQDLPEFHHPFKFSINLKERNSLRYTTLKLEFFTSKNLVELALLMESNSVFFF